jgi:hypothetical protein
MMVVGLKVRGLGFAVHCGCLVESVVICEFSGGEMAFPRVRMAEFQVSEWIPSSRMDESRVEVTPEPVPLAAEPVKVTAEPSPL